MSRESGSDSGVGVSVSPAVISPVSFFFFLSPCRNTEREREREREGEGKRSGCLKVCGRHVTCCAPLCSAILAFLFVNRSPSPSPPGDRFLFPQPNDFRDVTASNRRARTQKVQTGCGEEGGGGGGEKCKQIRS